ncbi:MAG: hypothetical protein ABFS02_00555 [Pseudomonadota bacterium]
MTGGQTEVREDPGNHRGFFDGGDDLHVATTVSTVFDVGIEHPFKQTGPADADRSRGMGRISVFLGSE